MLALSLSDSVSEDNHTCSLCVDLAAVIEGVGWNIRNNIASPGGDIAWPVREER